VLSSVLGLGFLIGMQHALEADHLAAVSSLVSRRRGLASISWHGAMWGIGHMLTLLVVAGTCIYFRTTLSDHVAERLDLAVGVMLVVLGALVLWRLWQDRVHFGAHVHGDGTRHAHVHSHRGETAPHAASAHAHPHHARGDRMPWRALFVGTIHGMAGSAALVVLAASSIPDPLVGIFYVLLFGIGSVLGMAALSAVIALPLTFTASRLVGLNRTLQLVIGVTTVALGISVVAATSSTLFALA
jgi:hypothetical protein